MWVAPGLACHPVLASPSLAVATSSETVLGKLLPETAIDITSEIVSTLRISDSQVMSLSDDEFEWVIQNVGFGLRVVDPGVFGGALEVCYRWLAQIVAAVSARGEQRLREIMAMMSQVFRNDAFTQERCSDFVRRMREMFTRKDLVLSDDTWRVVIFVLLCAAEETQILPGDVGLLAIVVMAREWRDGGEFLREFDNKSRQLLQKTEFVTAWVNMFQKVYNRGLMGQLHAARGRISDADVEDGVFEFLRRGIDDGLGPDEKQRAFSMAIKNWMAILCAKDSKMMVQSRMPAQEITDVLGNWLSIEAEWNRSDYVWMDEVWHPLFALLKLGENDIDVKFRELAKQWVRKVLNMAEGTENDSYWYLPVYAFDFLLENIELLKDLKDKLGEWCDRAIRVGFNDSMQSMMVICLEMLRVLDTDDPVRDKLFALLSFESSEPHVMATSMLCLMFTSRGDLFWKQVNHILLSDAFGEYTSQFALIAGFAPHVRDEVRTQIFLDNGIWEHMKNGDEVQHRLFLLFLMSLSTGSQYFNKNPEMGARVLDFASPKNDTIEQLRKMLRLAVISGKQQPLPEEFRSMDCLERLATRDFIITVFEKHLVIRHGLGAAVYEIEDLGSQPTPPVPPLEIPSVPTSTRPKSSPMDGLDASLEAEISELEAHFSGEGDFYEYTESKPPPSTHISPAHAFLCDMGFISANCHTYTKRVTSAMEQTVGHLDSIRAYLHIPVFVMQLLKPDVIESKETPILLQVLEDLKQNRECNICSFEFQAPYAISRDPSGILTYAERTGILVVVNETGSLVNEKCPTFAPFTLVLCISPLNDSIYNVQLLFQGSSIFALKQQPVSSLRLHIPRSGIGAVVALFTFFVTATTTGSRKEGQVTVSDCFSHGFCNRTRHISNIFDRSEAGRNAILVECLRAATLC